MDKRDYRSRRPFVRPSLRTSMDAGDQRTGVPVQSLGDCYYLISCDLVRINVDRLRRLVALTNRSFYSRDESATDATVKMASRVERCRQGLISEYTRGKKSNFMQPIINNVRR